MEDKHFDDSAETLPTFDENIGISRRSMLKDPEEEPKIDEDEEKSSIERKTIYDNLAQKEHFFSKTDIKASDEFEKEMLKKKELNEEKRNELIDRERRAKRAKLQEEIYEAQRNGQIVDPEKYLELAKLSDEIAGVHKKANTNDLANELNRRISHDLHTTREEVSETEKSIRKGILAAIAIEIVLVFIFTPNEIFIFPTAVRYVLTIISAILALTSIIILIVTGNMAAEHRMPPKQQAIYFWASIFPGAILRVLFGTLLAKAFEFIPIAGIYIGYCIGVAIGATIHYAILRRYYISENNATSIINSLAAIVLFIIPNLISGTINQPMDQKSQFGFTIYLIEAVFIIIVDEIIFLLLQRKKSK